MTRGEEDALDLVGKWGDLGYVSGVLGDDDPLLCTWELAVDEQHLGKSLKHACRALYNTTNPEAGVLKRMEELWDRRANLVKDGTIGPKALNGFQWLVKSRVFGEDWWMTRLEEASSLNPQPHNLHFINDELIATSHIDPLAALTVLSNCTREALKDDSAGYWLFADIAVPILYEARNLHEEDTKRAAAKCMDNLARLGIISLDKDIEEYGGMQRNLSD